MLKVHRCEDSKYDINWVVDNHKEVMLNREYEERHEPTYSGISIVVEAPDDADWLMEYGHNEEGFMSVSDFKKRGRLFEVIPTNWAIELLLENTRRVLQENQS